ncbi:MAG: gluconeogenesis factor YvcK family protein, partial [Nitriliruptoraceae bacterium]
MSGGGSAPHVVAVGGGHGCARTLAALRILGVRTTAVVSVADDGGSSGRLRRDHGVVALGDLRAALLALTPEDSGREVLRDLVAHRFAAGDLDGHSLGNLILLARLEARGGDLVAALDDVAALLGAAGRVADAHPVAAPRGAPPGRSRSPGRSRWPSGRGRRRACWRRSSGCTPAPRGR